MNTFGKQIKSALENPEERIQQKNKEFQQQNQQAVQNAEESNIDNEANNPAINKVDTTMDVISHSINVMIMKEAKMND